MGRKIFLGWKNLLGQKNLFGEKKVVGPNPDWLGLSLAKKMTIECNADAHANAWGTEKYGLGLWTASEVCYESESESKFELNIALFNFFRLNICNRK